MCCRCRMARPTIVSFSCLRAIARASLSLSVCLDPVCLMVCNCKVRHVVFFYFVLRCGSNDVHYGFTVETMVRIVV